MGTFERLGPFAPAPLYETGYLPWSERRPKMRWNLRFGRRDSNGRPSSGGGFRKLRREAQSEMSDQSPSDRFKAEMPEIPGTGVVSQRGNLLASPALRLVAGLVLVLVVVFFGARALLRPKHAEMPIAEPPPKIEVPSPAPDPTAEMPHATAQNPQIATISEMEQSWSSKQFFIRNALTGQNVPAMLIRLPSGSVASENGYWAFSLNAPYGDCQLEYVRDLTKLKNDYDFKAARHPMVGNPCTRTLFDPLKLANLPGNIWVRGAIAQGSDLRPPLGIELKIEGKNVEATRME